MDLLLEDVDRENLEEYSILLNSACLSHYMRRTRPHEYEHKTEKTLFWKYISINHTKVGAIWLEKDQESADLATLGIFISSADHRAKGIGTASIRTAIEQSQLTMCFTKIELRVRATNTRAIHCYRRCGFIEVNRFIKCNGMEEYEVIQMLREV